MFFIHSFVRFMASISSPNRNVALVIFVGNVLLYHRTTHDSFFATTTSMHPLTLVLSYLFSLVVVDYCGLVLALFFAFFDMVCLLSSRFLLFHCNHTGS